ncbi:MAG: hypothetical protein KJ939_04190 [Nanoarchaeota archaeon]|nr:hypothetical protein [Nanoarchaeota archaeon]
MPEKEVGTLQKLILALVVILVIAGIIFLFYPDMGQRIGQIADEVFGTADKAEQVEQADTFVKDFLLSMDKCLNSNFNECYCNLERDKFPENYLLKLENKDGLVMTLISDENMLLDSKKVENIKVSLAVLGQYGPESDLACKPMDILITNKEGKLIIKQIKFDSEEYEFYTNKGLSIPEIFKFENELCLVTTKVEKDSEPINKGQVKLLTQGKKFLEKSDKLKEILWSLDSLKSCSNVANSNNQIIWPIDPSNINSISSCYNLKKDSFGYGLNVKERSVIKVPVFAGVIIDYCEIDCGSDGSYITIYEVYNNEKKPVLDDYGNKRYIKISGFSSINQGGQGYSSYKSKGIVTGDSVSGLLVHYGEELGYSTDKLLFDIGFDGLNLAESAASKKVSEKILCDLPKLNDKMYSGKDCKISCVNNVETAEQSLESLINWMSRLEDRGKGVTTIKLDTNQILIGFGKDQAEFGDKFWSCNSATGKGPFLGSEDKPKQCRDKPCLCLCDSDDCEEAVCKTFDSGFIPTFMQGGEGCEFGPFIDSLDYLAKVYFERKGQTLGLCTKLPCIII